MGPGDLESDGDRGLETGGRACLGQTARSAAAAQAGRCARACPSQDLMVSKDRFSFSRIEISSMATTEKDQKKYFTVAEANSTLPLLRSILRDITDLAKELRK